MDLFGSRGGYRRHCIRHWTICLGIWRGICAGGGGDMDWILRKASEEFEGILTINRRPCSMLMTSERLEATRPKPLARQAVRSVS